MTKFDLLDLFKNLFVRLENFVYDLEIDDLAELEKIKRYTLENLMGNKLYYEDQAPLLYLKGALGDVPRTSDIKYVIIDEAQDYTPLQYEIYHQLFGNANITMLGDLNQAINPYMNVGSYENIAHIFPLDNTCLLNLTKSYRSTMEITKFARELLDKKITDEWVERRGESPLILGFSTEEQIQKKIIEDVDFYIGKGYKSIGIITRTGEEATELYDYLKTKVALKLLLRDDDMFARGAVVIPSYLSKGLEFDVVLIYNATNGSYSEEERMLFYTVCTRALHVLCVYYSGEKTTLLNHYEGI
jgi:DNA helicase-2/ATP-dependent DNA helicase PcrA